MHRFESKIFAGKEENRKNPNRFQGFLTPSSRNLWYEDAYEDAYEDLFSGSLVYRLITIKTLTVTYFFGVDTLENKNNQYCSNFETYKMAYI